MEQLPKEVEAGLSTLIRLGMGEADEDGGKKDAVQPWFRVLALEIIRGCVRLTCFSDYYAHHAVSAAMASCYRTSTPNSINEGIRNSSRSSFLHSVA